MLEGTNFGGPDNKPLELRSNRVIKKKQITLSKNFYFYILLRRALPEVKRSDSHEWQVKFQFSLLALTDIEGGRASPRSNIHENRCGIACTGRQTVCAADRAKDPGWMELQHCTPRINTKISKSASCCSLC